MVFHRFYFDDKLTLKFMVVFFVNVKNIRDEGNDRSAKNEDTSEKYIGV